MNGINELLGGLNVHLGFKKARMTLLFFLSGGQWYLSCESIRVDHTGTSHRR